MFGQIQAAKVRQGWDICKGEVIFVGEMVSELNSNDLLRCADAMDKVNADWQSAEDEEARAIADGSGEPCL